MKRFLEIKPSIAVPMAELPALEFNDFREHIIESIHQGRRLAAFYGSGDSSGKVRIIAVLADDQNGLLYAASSFPGDSFDSLTSDCPQAHWFEREIAEQWSVKPEGHPWLKPIRFHTAYRDGKKTSGTPRQPEPVCGTTGFFQVSGDEIHEVAVGPVHAGIIEPGHFRFQCHGEDVLHLEISLGYQHRGIERRLIGGPDKKTAHYMETLAGDTTIGHTLAYCQAIEALSGLSVPARGQVLRAIALELERIANHVGDLGALAGDVAFLPTASYCGRIRGDFLNMTAVLCGNRFGRGLVRPGGIMHNIDERQIQEIGQRLLNAEQDTLSAVNLLWSNSSVMARFEETGVVSKSTAETTGLVGVAARASGLERDIRRDFPQGYYQYAHIPVSTWNNGDVFARAFVRWMEIQRSIAFIKEQIKSIPGGPISVPEATLKPDSLVVSLTEGWRGEICHCIITDRAGRVGHYKVIDPSFHNWFGLALALRNQQISDFPLCNKSFNLSYCGHDL
ncbi:MAG: NADH-quinone oxidoreductase subunit C [Candidatus Brocadiia bacterium]